MPMIARPVLAVMFLAVFAASASAQDTTKPKPEASRAGMMDDHMMGPWKEMNAFHRVMGATWHPASQKGDLAPLKAKAKELLSAAEAWSASNPPAAPASCGDSAVKAAAKTVVVESKALVAMIDAGADDARLKAGLKSVHDAFEVAEKGCGGHGEHGNN